MMSPSGVPLTALALLACCLACSAAPSNTTIRTPFSSCAEKKDPIALKILSCTQPPCRLPKGTTAIMEVDFEIDEDTDGMEVTVRAYAMGMIIDYPLKQKDGCKALTNAECPLDKYEAVHYRLEMELDKDYPSISVVAEVAMKDKKKKRTIMCFKANLQVVDPE